MIRPIGVILAAGTATRMGRPKQLLAYGDTTVLGSVVTAASASRLERVILVLGAYADEVLAAVDVSGVDVVHNPDPARGNLSSLLVAVEAAEPGAALLLVMADMPGLTAEIIDAHLDAWEGDPAWIRFTRYADGSGHPLMLSPELVAELCELAGPKALWPLTESERAEELVVGAPMPVDVDTPADYEEALERNLRKH